MISGLEQIRNLWTNGFAAVRIASATPGWQQYVLVSVVFILVSLLNLWLNRWTGYQAIALVYLLSVVLLAVLVSRAPIIFGTALTAAAWNYLFAPPRFAFNISDFYDNMMLVTYFVVTLTVTRLTNRLRQHREPQPRPPLSGKT
jgi:two-component system sensor histidine kinase KdpD